MYYIVQEDLFKETNYGNLIVALNRLGYPYEIVKIRPFTDDIEFKTNRKDVFPFGAIKIGRISKQYGWNPGSQLNDNHDFMVYKDYYKENLLNWDSEIIKFGDLDFFSEKRFFARPTEDTKIFTGKVFDMQEWRDFRDNALSNGHTGVLSKDSLVQISSVKIIQQEIRMWVVKGEIVTVSQYKLGNRVVHNNIIDQSAYDFGNKMIKLFELNDAFVLDICLVNNEYKIVECGCINCAGFYAADLQKLLFSLEEAFN